MLLRTPILVVVCLSAALLPVAPRAAAPPAPAVPDRSPVDLALTRDGRWLLTANQTSGTASLVRLADGAVVQEVACGKRPSAVALTPDDRTALVSATHDGELVFLDREEGLLRKSGSLRLGFEPRGIAVTADGKLAYVALTAAASVAVVDVAARKELARIPTGRWPRFLALSPDGKRLAVGVAGDGGVGVIDTEVRKQLYIEDFLGLNLGQMQVSRDG